LAQGLRKLATEMNSPIKHSQAMKGQVINAHVRLKEACGMVRKHFFTVNKTVVTSTFSTVTHALHFLDLNKPNFTPNHVGQTSCCESFAPIRSPTTNIKGHPSHPRTTDIKGPREYIPNLLIDCLYNQTGQMKINKCSGLLDFSSLRHDHAH
jgi:hypothetical protein